MPNEQPYWVLSPSHYDGENSTEHFGAFLIPKAESKKSVIEAFTARMVETHKGDEAFWLSASRKWSELLAVYLRERYAEIDFEETPCSFNALGKIESEYEEIVAMRAKRAKPRKSMPYGELPSYDEFTKAFQTYIHGRYYSFSSDSRVGNAEMTCRELWEEVSAAVAQWENGEGKGADHFASQKVGWWAGDWAAAVLFHLHFQWE